MAVEIRAATYAALRTALAAGTYQEGQAVYVESSDGSNRGAAGWGHIEASGTDNGVTVIANASGLAWVRDGASPEILQEWLGAVADGVTDDSSAVATAEGVTTPSVNLQGKTLAVTSFAADAGGVVLRHDYKNGQIVVDGKTIVFDEAEGKARASSIVLPSSKSVKPVGIRQASSTDLEFFRCLGGIYWHKVGLVRADTSSQYDVQWQTVEQFLSYKTLADGGHVFGGTWADLYSGSVNTYINGSAKQSTSDGDTIDVTFDGGGDVYVIYAGRDDGNFVNVLLNGSQDYLVLPDDGAGNKYFDSYASPEITYKQIAHVASGVPSGTHTLKLTVSALQHASSGPLDQFLYNCIAWVDASTAPWAPQTRSKQWASGAAVLKNEERQYGGIYYYADAAGTTGGTPPTHTSGSASDGAVTWVYRSTSGYALPSVVLQAPNSRLEYAYMIKPDGATNREDVGGAVHGNESLVSTRLISDNRPVNLPIASWVTGETVALSEKLSVTHSEIDSGSTEVVETKVVREFSRAGLTVLHTHDFKRSAELGWWYSAMWPLLHYVNATGGYKYVTERFWSPCGTAVEISDYYWDAENPPYNDDAVETTKDYLMVAEGALIFRSGAAGSPATKSADDPRFIAWLSVSPESVAHFQPNNRTFASKSINPSDKKPSDDWNSSMISKMYFMRYDGNAPTTVPSGTKISCRAEYGLAIGSLEVFG